MIGGSQISKGESVSTLGQTSWLGRGCGGCEVLFVLAAMLLFGGAAGNWFSVQHAGGQMLLRCLQLAAGSAVMGLLVAVPGSLLFGRNPIRWGMGMPVLVYLGGAFMAFVSGRDGAAGLLFGAPLLLGLAIAAGVMGAFAVDGLLVRRAGV
jgi:hypothetical protein